MAGYCPSIHRQRIDWTMNSSSRLYVRDDKVRAMICRASSIAPDGDVRIVARHAVRFPTGDNIQK